MDVAVIGASTSGLHSATLLAESGMTVEVLERADDIKPAERTLIVTPRLREYVGEVCDRAVSNEIRGFELFANGKVASFPLRKPDLVVERSAVIKHLLSEAECKGVRVRLGCRFVDAEPGRGAIVAKFKTSRATESISTRHLIGADGASSRVRRAFGWAPQATVPLLQARVNLPSGMPSDVARVWFRPQETPFFYWLIPESPTIGAVGLIGANRASVRRQLAAFMADKGLNPLSFQSAQVSEYTGWIAPTRRFDNGLAVHLIGDAAGHVKVSTVGGLVTGFRGALGVSQSILTGRIGPELRSLRIELNAHLLVKRVLHRFGQSHYVDLLHLLERNAGDHFANRTRDEAPQALARVLLANPRIALIAARALITGRAEEDAGSDVHEIPRSNRDVASLDRIPS